MENIEPVNVLLVVPGKETSTNIKNILRDYGFSNVTVGTSLEQLTSNLTKPIPDLIICNAEFVGGDSCELIRDIRLYDLGENPFIPIITITGEPSETFVQKIISSGTDALIIEPFSAQQLLDRIDGLVKERRQFVATSDYMGPDRRPTNRGQNDHDILKFDVPNTLRAKVIGENVGNIDLTIKTLMTEMKECQLGGQYHQIVYFAGKITSSYDDTGRDKALESLLVKLQFVTQGVIDRIAGTPFEHVTDLCRSIMQVTVDIRDPDNVTVDKSIQLLTQLSLAIQLGFTSSTSASAVQEITDTVSQN